MNRRIRRASTVRTLVRTEEHPPPLRGTPFNGGIQMALRASHACGPEPSCNTEVFGQSINIVLQNSPFEDRATEVHLRAQHPPALRATPFNFKGGIRWGDLLVFLRISGTGRSLDLAVRPAKRLLSVPSLRGWREAPGDVLHFVPLMIECD